MDIKPAIIIPFSLTKEEAQAAYLKKVKSAKLSEVKFRLPSNLSEFKKIYIPYWICRAKTTGIMKLSGTESHANGSREVTNIYNVSVNISGKYEGLAFSASSLEKDRTDELAPFPADLMTEYDEKYTEGCEILPFISDADTAKSEALKLISDDIYKRVSTNDALSQFKLHTVHGKTITGSLPDLQVEMVPALLPVWMLVTRSFDRVSYAYVNGVTGKVSADLPVNFLKFLGASGIFTAVFALIISTLTRFEPPTWMWVCSCLAMAVNIIYTYNCGALQKKDGYKRKRKREKKETLSEKIFKIFDKATDIDEEQNARNFFFYLIIGIIALGIITVLSIFSSWLIPLIGTLSCLYYAVHKLKPSYFPVYIVELLSMIFAMGIYLSEPDNKAWYDVGSVVLNISTIISLITEEAQFNLLSTAKIAEKKEEYPDVTL